MKVLLYIGDFFPGELPYSIVDGWEMGRCGLLLLSLEDNHFLQFSIEFEETIAVC